MYTAAVYSGYQNLKMRLKVFVVLLLEGLSHFCLNTVMEVVYFGGKHILGVIYLFIFLMAL